MAQRVQVLLVCDLHDDETPATETVRFALAGAAYEIDLCEVHVSRLRDSMAPYVGAARRATGGGSRSKRGHARSGRSSRAGEIRDWARRQGMDVPKRGRIPAAIVEEYEAAH